MDQYEKEKKHLFQYLRQTLLTGVFYNVFTFFPNFFDYFRLRKLLNIQEFTEEETNTLNECMNNLIEVISENLGHYLTRYYIKDLYKVLKIRSVLEFFKTDFIKFINENSKEKLKKITAYNSDIGEIPNFDGIPESHYWWTQHHRNGDANPPEFDFEEYSRIVCPDYKTL
uniref:Uncharacterized protein n=1 Tax=Panagrolaimus superbus TaxID=310955 RepID=A0A914ZA56_9BILA